VWELISELWSVAFHVRSHSVACHPTPDLIQAGRYSVHLPQRDGRLILLTYFAANFCCGFVVQVRRSGFQESSDQRCDTKPAGDKPAAAAGNLVSGPASEDSVETSVFYQSVMTWKNLQVKAIIYIGFLSCHIFFFGLLPFGGLWQTRLPAVSIFCSSFQSDVVFASDVAELCRRFRPLVVWPNILPSFGSRSSESCLTLCLIHLSLNLYCSIT